MAGIIQSYGLYWKANNVYWRAGNRNGKLLGRPVDARTAQPTNFRMQVGIYVLYRDHKLIYVGDGRR